MFQGNSPILVSTRPILRELGGNSPISCDLLCTKAAVLEMGLFPTIICKMGQFLLHLRGIHPSIRSSTLQQLPCPSYSCSPLAEHLHSCARQWQLVLQHWHSPESPGLCSHRLQAWQPLRHRCRSATAHLCCQRCSSPAAKYPTPVPHCSANHSSAVAQLCCCTALLLYGSA